MISESRPNGFVLVVCTGNVCRSPLIQLLLTHALADTQIRVTSAGTGPIPQHSIDPRTAGVARELGVDELATSPRRVTRAMVDAADLVLTASRRHRSEVAALHPPALSYAFALVDVADLAPSVSLDRSVASSSEFGAAPTRVARVARAVARERGAVAPRNRSVVDIVDPYHRPDEVYDEMVRQVRNALPPVVDLLRGTPRTS